MMPRSPISVQYSFVNFYIILYPGITSNRAIYVSYALYLNKIWYFYVNKENYGILRLIICGWLQQKVP